MKNIFLVIALFLAIPQGYSQFNQASLDSVLDILDEKSQFMGSLAISEKGKVIYARAIGYSNLELDVKSNVKTKYRVGSISKVFTSTLVFMAIDEGKIKLDDPLSKYIKEFPKGDEITISQLLNHHSGIYNFTNVNDYLDWCTMRFSREEILKKIIDNGFAFEPGAKGEYSNSNYVLLTFIVEDVFGKSYSELINKKIAKPLGLTHTKVGDVIDVKNNECYSYSYSSDWEKSYETDMSVPLGAGAIISTPTDLNTFSWALFSGELISEQSLASMKEIKDNFGRGLFQFPYNSKVAFGHTGGVDSFSSMFGCIEEDGLSVALTSNGNRYSNNKIMIAALASYYGDEVDVPVFEDVEYSAEELNAFVGKYESNDIPLPIEVILEGKELMAQAQGQSAFTLSVVRRNVFSFDAAGIVMEFEPKNGTFVLKQGGGEYLFKKK
jgi:CubicO group peptidase (beta-lactamase class C family)